MIRRPARGSPAVRRGVSWTVSLSGMTGRHRADRRSPEPGGGAERSAERGPAAPGALHFEPADSDLRGFRPAGHRAASAVGHRRPRHGLPAGGILIAHAI